jgi:N-acetylmuramoyl-L-alanine amidase
MDATLDRWDGQTIGSVETAIAGPRTWALHVVSCVVTLALCACASTPFTVMPNIKVEQRPAANFDQRRPNYVVLHHTSDNSAESALRTLTSASSGVSTHYLISRDGEVYYLVDETQRAWHAGESYWAGQHDLNSGSIGIELDNNGHEPFAEPQIVALLALLGDLKARYNLSASSFLGHGDIAPGRKVDPSVYFPWKRLVENGFGLWCDPPYPVVPPDLDSALLLQAFGYNTWNLNATIAAFKRRFVPDDPAPTMTDKDRAILYCLVQQMQSAAPQQ